MDEITELKRIWESTEQRLSQLSNQNETEEEESEEDTDIESFNDFMDNVLDIERIQYLSSGKWATKEHTIVIGTGGPHVETTKIKLTFHAAVEYVWKNSKQIRDWYTTEHKFDLNDYTRSEYRTSGLGAPGDIISEIVVEGIRDGIINEDDDGEYWTVE